MNDLFPSLATIAVTGGHFFCSAWHQFPKSIFRKTNKTGGKNPQGRHGPSQNPQHKHQHITLLSVRKRGHDLRGQRAAEKWEMCETTSVNHNTDNGGWLQIRAPQQAGVLSTRGWAQHSGSLSAPQLIQRRDDETWSEAALTEDQNKLRNLPPLWFKGKRATSTRMIPELQEQEPQNCCRRRVCRWIPKTLRQCVSHNCSLTYPPLFEEMKHKEQHKVTPDGPLILGAWFHHLCTCKWALVVFVTLVVQNDPKQRAAYAKLTALIWSDLVWSIWSIWSDVIWWVRRAAHWLH